MIQVLPGNSDNLSTSATQYLLPGGNSYSSTTEADVEAIMPSAGTIDKLRINLSTAPGAGTSRTFTLRVNGVDSALTLTISDAATTGADVSHTVTVAAGDRVSIKSTLTGTPAIAYCRNVVNFTDNTASQSMIVGTGRNIQLSTSATQYKAVAGDVINTGIGTTESDHRQLIAVAGTVKNLYVNLVTAPGVGATRTFTVYKNGVATALTCTISDAATTGNDTTHSFSVAAGDELTLESTLTGTPAATKVRHGITVVATTDGEAPLMGGYAAASPGSADTRFNNVIGGANMAGTAETSNVQLVNACTIKKLYVKFYTTYTGTVTHDVRVNGASPANNPSVAITGGSSTGNDTTHSASCASGDTVDLRVQRPSDANVKQTAFGLVIVANTPTTTVLTPSENLSNLIIETLNRAWTAPRSQNENMSIGESTSRSWSLSRGLPIDNISITEIIGSFKGRILDILENLGVVESFSRGWSAVRAFSDSPTITEILSRAIFGIRSAIDQVVIIETLTVSKVLSVIISNVVSIVEWFRTPLNWKKRTKPTSTWRPRVKP